MTLHFLSFVLNFLYYLKLGGGNIPKSLIWELYYFSIILLLFKLRNRYVGTLCIVSIFIVVFFYTYYNSFLGILALKGIAIFINRNIPQLYEFVGGVKVFGWLFVSIWLVLSFLFLFVLWDKKKDLIDHSAVYRTAKHD